MRDNDFGPLPAEVLAQILGTNAIPDITNGRPITTDVLNYLESPDNPTQKLASERYGSRSLTTCVVIPVHHDRGIGGIFEAKMLGYYYQPGQPTGFNILNI